MVEEKYHNENGEVNVELFKDLCRPIILFMKNTGMQGITFSLDKDEDGYWSYKVDADYRKPIPLNIRVDLQKEVQNENN